MKKGMKTEGVKEAAKPTHTPGPCRCDETSCYYPNCAEGKTESAKPGPYPLKVVRSGHIYIVVTNQGNHFTQTYDPAAARLIAAAPDLLAALKKLVTRHPAPCGFTITKKHDDCYTCGKTPDGQGGTRICDECAPVFDARAAILRATEGK